MQYRLVTFEIMQKGTAHTTSSMNPVLRLLADPAYRWFRHTFFIVVGLILSFKDDVYVPELIRSDPAIVKGMLKLDISLFFLLMGLMYLQILVFVPKLLFRSKMFWFAVSFFGCIVFAYLAAWFFDDTFSRPVMPGNNLIPHIELSFTDLIEKGLIIGIMMGCVIGLMVFKKWLNDVQRMNDVERTNLKTELDQLKSQVNPHFLFNTLNNLHVLIKTDPEKATQVVLGLSDLLRYQLYDSSREKIIFTKDIAFLENVLALEKIRKDDFTYTIHTEGKTEGIAIPPFIFIPFVENAVKHGASSVGHSYLHLNFKITDSHLFFTAENSKPPIKHKSVGGLGLKNIQRRLELLYPGTHTVTITEDAAKYIVNLTIPL
jgi:hypothetical protein